MASRYRIDEAGMAQGACWVPSPNRDERPPDAAIELIVVHAISLPPGCFGGSAVVDLFTNGLDPQAHPFYRDIADLRVSAHFFVDRQGVLTQFVSCRDRAWHAGASSWCGRERCNDFSVGIELEGCDERPFEEAQYESLADLTRALQARYPITAAIGHSDVAPGRKTDPGPFFDWRRYRQLVRIG